MRYNHLPQLLVATTGLALSFTPGCGEEGMPNQACEEGNCACVEGSVACSTDGKKLESCKDGIIQVTECNEGKICEITDSTDGKVAICIPAGSNMTADTGVLDVTNDTDTYIPDTITEDASINVDSQPDAVIDRSGIQISDADLPYTFDQPEVGMYGPGLDTSVGDTNMRDVANDVLDLDNDGIENDQDNCPELFNPLQLPCSEQQEWTCNASGFCQLALTMPDLRWVTVIEDMDGDGQPDPELTVFATPSECARISVSYRFSRETEFTGGENSQSVGAFESYCLPVPRPDNPDGFELRVCTVNTNGMENCQDFTPASSR